MANVKLSNVIRRAQTKVDKDDTDLVFYVGGEHIESENIRVHSRGIIAESTIGPMFYYGFKAGDFLLVSRNPHLKKAGLVDFDGICSEKTFVLETANSDVLLPEFLPFVLQNERFWDYAYRHRHGSTNTFINWSTLANYEFELPDLETQRKLAEVLWSINDTMEAYKNLISATDELVKSQFMEQFGDATTNPKGLPTALIRDVAECYAGATPSTKVAAYWDDATIPWMSSGEVHNGRVSATEKKISQAGYDSCSTKMVPANSVVIALAGQGKTRGTVAITEIELCTNQSLCCIIPNSSVMSDYLYYHLKLRYEEMRNLAGIAEGRGGLNLKLIQGIRILVPSKADQEEFIAFARQSDKSKFELEQALAELNATYKRIIAENLG